MVEELHFSKLGSKEYWNEIYTKEMENFNEFGDKGECWFGEDSAMRMVHYCEEFERDITIVDLGCGNGHLLFELHELGFQHLIGLDYSPESIQLCKQIATKENVVVEFMQADILSNELSCIPVVDVFMDKGTFDAISLSGIPNACKTYVDHIHGKLKPNGKIIITSCNWIEEELLEHFQPLFQFYDRIKYPTFQFGGVVGQTITTIILEKI
jgi:SAM-dependent methyltransferase